MKCGRTCMKPTWYVSCIFIEKSYHDAVLCKVVDKNPASPYMKMKMKMVAGESDWTEPLISQFTYGPNSTSSSLICFLIPA